MMRRHQLILFSVLVIASLVMGILLWRLRERAHQRLVAGEDSAPTKAPHVVSSEKATLMIANDDDNSLRGQVYSLPLPADPGARARAILARLLDLYAAPGATHPVAGGAKSIEQVFLLPATGASRIDSSSPVNSDGPQMAVVNLAGSFVASHPAGLETETLTVLSICGTLHANFPRITEVRFLVDGKSQESLAGHADLTQTYLVADTAPGELVQP